MKNTSYISLILFILGQATHGIAQELNVLSKSQAVSIALENNFDIRAANNDVSIAQNNSALANSGYLPNISGTAGSSRSRANSDLIFTDGNSTTIKAAKSSASNASLNLDYTIFNGFGRKYNYKKLQENYHLSEIQSRTIIENTLINLFNSYYEIARLSENEVNQKETLDISRERWTRAKYSFEFGQNSRLDILNAEVDFNTDSINFLTIVQQLKNEKRNLNLLMGRDINVDFAIDTILVFEEHLIYDDLALQANRKNTTLVQQQGNLNNAGYDMQISKSALIPNIGLNSSYGWNSNQFAPGNFLSERTSTALNLGATLTWNIFDGGISNTQKQNSKLRYEKQKIFLEQTQLDLERQLRNAWTVYQTALFVMVAEDKNKQTNQLNFIRSKEQYELGQINSIAFRQAQFNLLNAKLNYNRAKYSAKVAELALKRLSGTLLEATF
jgi:outer membrane protein TolC